MHTDWEEVIKTVEEPGRGIILFQKRGQGWAIQTIEDYASHENYTVVDVDGFDLFQTDERRADELFKLLESFKDHVVMMHGNWELLKGPACQTVLRAASTPGRAVVKRNSEGRKWFDFQGRLVMLAYEGVHFSDPLKMACTIFDFRH